MMPNAAVSLRLPAPFPCRWELRGWEVRLEGAFVDRAKGGVEGLFGGVLVLASVATAGRSPRPLTALGLVADPVGGGGAAVKSSWR